MAYITKAMLERQVKIRDEMIKDMDKQIRMQEEQLKFFRSYTPGGYVSAMAIALEKVTEAVAHVITDLKTMRR